MHKKLQTRYDAYDKDNQLLSTVRGTEMRGMADLLMIMKEAPYDLLTKTDDDKG